MQEVGIQLRQMDTKLNILISGQVAIYEDLLNKLDANQLALTQKLQDSLDANQVSEPQRKQMLAVLEKRIPSLPPSQAAIAEVIKDPELDVKQKLKVTLPIVPMLVEYKGEFELGSGFNIKSAWEQLVAKLRISVTQEKALKRIVVLGGVVLCLSIFLVWGLTLDGYGGGHKSYSEKPAEAISQHIDYVIGMNNPIQDKAAIEFARGFYDGLGYEILDNQDVFQRAFDEGVVAAQLENISQGQIPVLKKSHNTMTKFSIVF